MVNLSSIIKYSNLEKIAISLGNFGITYNELKIKVGNYAYYINSKGFKNQKIMIEILCPIETLSAYLGIIKSGNIAVLINSNLSQDLKESIVSDLGIDYKLDIQYFISNNDIDAIQCESKDPSTILLTSGTIQTKAVLLPHGMIFNIAKSIVPNGHRYIVLSNTPIYHMNGLFNILSTLANGGTIYLNFPFKLDSFTNFIDQFSINTVICLPYMINLLSDKQRFLKVKSLNLTSSITTRPVYDKAKTIFPNALIKIGYGTTEIGSRIFGKHPFLPTPPLSVGYPFDDIQYRLREDVLEIKHPGMFLDYFNLNNTRITDDGFFITQDRFYIDKDGFYFFIGRSDETIISGGNKIDLVEIESFLETHTSIISAAVIAVPDQFKFFLPYAFVIVNDSITENEIMDYFKSKLNKIHCPVKVWVLDNLPYTSIGKVNKSLLLEEARKRINVN